MRNEADAETHFESDTDRFTQQSYESLLGLGGELFIQGATTRTLVQHQDNDLLSESVNMMSRLIEEVREHVLRLRTIPVALLFARYQKAITANAAIRTQVVFDNGENLIDDAVGGGFYGA